MSVEDERDLRMQLAGLLDSVDARPAPVATTIRRGRRIRIRRRLFVVVGLAVIGTAAAGLPAVLSGLPHSAGPLAPPHYSVRVDSLGPTARRNVIAQGVTDGENWKVVGTPPHGADNDSYMRGVGAGAGPLIGVNNMPSPTAAEPVLMESAPSLSGQFIALFGTVSQQVTIVALRLPDGKRVILRPVSWDGARWVGVVIPVGVPVVRAVADSGTGEVAYAVPFRDVMFEIWWQPGQVGPARLTRSIGSGVIDGKPWHATAWVGPWGWCYSVAGFLACLGGAPAGNAPPHGQLVRPLGCSFAADQVPAGGVVFVAPSVRRVELLFSDGTSASFRTVEVTGIRVFGYAVPANVQVTSSREYGPQGQLIGSEQVHNVGSSPDLGWAC